MSCVESLQQSVSSKDSLHILSLFKACQTHVFIRFDEYPNRKKKEGISLLLTDNKMRIQAAHAAAAVALANNIDGGNHVEW